MLFQGRKVFNLQQLCCLIKSVQIGLARLTEKMSQIPEAESIFEQVEVNSKELYNNMMTHSHTIGLIANMLTPTDCKVNIKTTHQILMYLQNWLQKYNREDPNQSIKQKVIRIMEIESKLCCLQEFLTPALTYQDDIAAFPLGSQPKYSQTYSLIDINQPLFFEELQQQYQYLRKLMIVTNAAVLTQLTQPNKILSLMAFGLSFPRFMIDINTAKIRNFAFLRKPNLQQLTSIWNLPQNGAISGLKYVQFPYIHTNTLIYIPQDQSKIPNCDLFSDSDQNSIAVRILSNKPITFWKNTLNCCSYAPDRTQFLENVIIHAHGGGFVSLSSSTMQNQTRLWSKELDAVVLSIDYKKPPKYRFPAPVYDFYNVYSFVCKHIHNFCNINPKKIILAGDSAGGNLVLGATAMALKAKLPKPLGIFLAYPACDLRSRYTPSRIYTFEDAILHPSLLVLCMRQYLGQNRKQIQNDPIASPILVSQSFVGGKNSNKWPSNWPITRIIVGEYDPLLDDSLRLCHRMTQSGTDVRCTIFRGVGHGFLSVQTIIKQGKKGIQKSITFMRQMLERP